MAIKENLQPERRWQTTLYEIIFEADTKTGKLFDVMLIIAILASVLAALLDSVEPIQKDFGKILYALEWLFTVLFTLGYFLRSTCVRRTLQYANSFFGIVDLLAILPTYLSLLFPGTQYLLVIRMLRVLRLFRVFKLVQYIDEAKTLMLALRASHYKIVVFLFTGIDPGGHIWVTDVSYRG